MKNTILTSLMTFSFTASAFAAVPADKVLTGQQVIREVFEVATSDDAYDGYLANGKKCSMTFKRNEMGSLVISISSGVSSVMLAGVVIPTNIKASVLRSGTSDVSKRTYQFYGADGVLNKFSITSYDDESSFDLTIDSHGKKATCRWQE